MVQDLEKWTMEEYFGSPLDNVVSFCPIESRRSQQQQSKCNRKSILYLLLGFKRHRDDIVEGSFIRQSWWRTEEGSKMFLKDALSKDFVKKIQLTLILWFVILITVSLATFWKKKKHGIWYQVSNTNFTRYLNSLILKFLIFTLIIINNKKTLSYTTNKTQDNSSRDISNENK